MYFTFRGLKKIGRYTGDVRGFRYIEVGGFIEVPLIQLLSLICKLPGHRPNKDKIVKEQFLYSCLQNKRRIYHKHKYFQCSLSIFLTVEGVSIFLVRIYYQNNSIYFVSYYLHYTIVSHRLINLHPHSSTE